MTRLLRWYESMGDGWTVLPQKYKQEKARGPALISARKLCLLAYELVFTARLVETRLNPGTGLVNPGAAASTPGTGTAPGAAAAYRR